MRSIGKKKKSDAENEQKTTLDEVKKPGALVKTRAYKHKQEKEKKQMNISD